MAIRSIALAGMVADTSLYNIDGACVVGGLAPIAVGTAVKVSSAQPIDGHKVVEATAIAASQAYGVVVRSHYETPDGTAKVQEAVNVMSAGRIWMRTTLTAAPTVGAAVLVTDLGVVAETGVATGWSFAGGFLTGFVSNGKDPIKQSESYDGALVEVQVKQK